MFNEKKNYIKGEYNSDNENSDSVFSKRIKAGNRRTYFFDVKPHKKAGYFIVITERRKIGIDERNFEKTKLFIHKEDFNRFVSALTETVEHIKNDLMPDYDFTAFDRKEFPPKDDNHTNDSIEEIDEL